MIDLRKQQEASDQLLETERLEADRALEATAAQLTAEAAASAAARNAVGTRDQLLAIVSHDLKGPLNTILLSLAVVGSESAQAGMSPESRAAVNRIQRAARVMNQMIADLLDSERLANGHLDLQLEVREVAELAREALEQARAQAAAASVSLSADAPQSPVLATYDPRRMLQVVTNLVDNAIKHTPQGGKVSIGYTEDAEGVRLWVSDTGKGVEPEAREAIFTRFSQLGRKDRGSVGLGLFICRRLVEAHGGRIWVESVPDGGAKLVFTLPRAQPSEHLDAPENSDSPAAPSGADARM